VKKLGFGGGATFQRPLLENPIFFYKMHFSTLILPLAFFSLCSQKLSIVHVGFFSVFVLFRFWSLDHRVKFFSFFFIFSSPFFIFTFFFLFFPFYFFPLSLLSCCLASLLVI
jgi:hypothetical protein